MIRREVVLNDDQDRPVSQHTGIRNIRRKKRKRIRKLKKSKKKILKKSQRPIVNLFQKMIKVIIVYALDLDPNPIVESDVGGPLHPGQPKFILGV